MTNKWRKALALMLALAMAASMAACGSSDGGSASTTAAAEAETEAAAEEAGETEEGEEPAEEATEGEEAAAADVDPNTKAADYYTAIGSMAGFFLTIPFEEKFVKFENTRKPIWMILRVLGGFAVYVGCNTLLKLPFSAEFLESGTMIALLVRSARYLLVMFAMMGLYPMLFKLEKRLRKKTQE